LLRQAGVSEAEIAEVMTWVSKTGLLRNPGTQALEDGACLVFLENEVTRFAGQHADFPRGKFVAILRKTWRKMSPAAREFARTLSLPAAVDELLREATAEEA
jgi:tRNAThr (cytosine32-N3)-methyltransferase